MPDLSVDTAVLIEAGHSLRAVASEFEHADSTSDDAADAVGEHDLADRVREFADNWKIRRGEMLEKIGTLAEQASVTGETFEQLDRDLAAAIRGEK